MPAVDSFTSGGTDLFATWACPALHFTRLRLDFGEYRLPSRDTARGEASKSLTWVPERDQVLTESAITRATGGLGPTNASGSGNQDGREFANAPVYAG